MLLALLLTIGLFLVWLWNFAIPKRPKNFPPGPSMLPVIGSVHHFDKDNLMKAGTLKQKFGTPLIGYFFGYYPVVVLNDAHSAKEMGRNDNFLARPPLMPILTRGRYGIAFNNGSNWQEQRKFTLKAFKSLGFGTRAMESLIQTEAKRLSDSLRLEVKSEDSIKINEIFNLPVFNVLWQIVAGESFEETDPKFIDITKIIGEAFIRKEISGFLYFMPWMSKIAPRLSGWTQFLNMIPPVVNYMQNVIDSHEKTFDPKNKRDLVDYMLHEIYNCKDSDSSLFKDKGYKNLLFVLVDMISAGWDTTSQTLVWSLLYLAKYPEVQEKLRKDIHNVIGHTRLPTFSDKILLPYMEATIAETLRKSSIVPLGFFHSALETTEFLGYNIPKDTVLMSNLHFIHNDPTYWKNPEEFTPERFIGLDGKFQHDDALLPFHIGKRSCPAEGLAKDELFIFLTTLLQRFRFEIDTSLPEPSLQPYIGLVATAQPFNLKVSEVKY